ncbi:MAG: hypothetical protein EGQ67_09520, partial [Clostridiales bacterium]|nr:hypothetical protein [Clostridiales bacterium]
KDGFVIDGEPGFVLQPFDQVFVHRSPGYNEQQNVEVSGQVLFAGTYTLKTRNARLSDIMRRCGGPTNMAYVAGAHLERKTNETERIRMQEIQRMAREQQQKNLLEIATRSSNAAGATTVMKQANDVEMQRYTIPDYYPVGIRLDEAMRNPGGNADIILRDGDRTSRIDYRAGNTLRISSETPIAALYLYWYTPCEAFTIHTAAGDVPGGEYGFLHEYLALPEAVTELDIEFSGLSPLCEVRLFTTGAAPADVQVWQPPCEQADVLLFPSHADDDVIFFGALAAQCVDRGLAVQVAYLVNHYDWQPRPQELLDALWTMGIRNYPVIGPFPDYYVLSLEAAQQSFGEENVIAYQVGLLRRFKPLVAVGHDREGEYGHGAHRLNALALEQAVVYAADASYDAESAAQYGVWDTPKLYLHFADENPIFLDVETPLESFGGKTAFEVASEAMLCHESQLQYAHRPTLASEEFPRYDCRRFGLVRSLVGADTGNDIMEHLS